MRLKKTSRSTDEALQALLRDAIVHAALSGAASAIATQPELTRRVLAATDELLGRALKHYVSHLTGALPTPRFTPHGHEVELPAELAPRPPIGSVLDMEATRSQATQARRKRVAEGELLNANDFLEHLGMSRTALTKAVETHRIFAVEVDAIPHYPAFYFSPLYDRKRMLSRVTRALRGLSGWAKLDFYESPNEVLGGQSPLEALAKGRLADVLTLATAYGDDFEDEKRHHEQASANGFG